MMRKLLALAIVLLLPVPALAGPIALKLVCQYASYIDKEGFHWLKDRFRLTFIIDDKGSAYMSRLRPVVTQIFYSADWPLLTRKLPFR
jgi:hypothetical protein